MVMESSGCVDKRECGSIEGLNLDVTEKRNSIIAFFQCSPIVLLYFYRHFMPFIKYYHIPVEAEDDYYDSTISTTPTIFVETKRSQELGF